MRVLSGDCSDGFQGATREDSGGTELSGELRHEGQEGTAEKVFGMLNSEKAEARGLWLFGELTEAWLASV